MSAHTIHLKVLAHAAHVKHVAHVAHSNTKAYSGTRLVS